MSQIERRKTARITKKFRIEIENDDNIQNLGSIDLSSMGVRFRTARKMPLFKQLNFKIDLSENEEKTKELSCRATVIRCEKSHRAKGYHITLFFHDMPGKDVKKIERFINKKRG